MRSFYVFLCMSLMVVGTMLGCSQNSDEVMLDSFEGQASRETVDYGSSSSTKIAVSFSKEQKVCGRQSLKIDYDLKKDGYMYCARGHGLDVSGAVWEAGAPESINWSAYPSMSVQVFGSKRGNIAFDVKDSGGELWRYMINDDFEGWKEIVVPFDQFRVREDWQPQTADGNRSLDFPVKSFQFEPKNPGVGAVYIDCVKLVNKYNQ